MNADMLQDTVAGSRPAAGRRGVLHWATDTKQLSYDDGAGWNNIIQLLTKIKAADETVNNSATLQNDDDLVFAVAANEEWVIELLILFGYDPSGDLKWKFSVPAGCGIDGIYFDGLTGSGTLGQFFVESDTEIFNAASGSSGQLFIRALVRVGGTAGNVQLQWAQNSAHASNLTFKKASTLLARRIS